MPATRNHDVDDMVCNSKKTAIHSRQMTRLGHMFWNAGTVVKRAKVWQRKDEAGRKQLEDSANKDDKHVYALIKLLAALEPDIVAELANGGRGSRALAELTETQLGKGQSNAKAEDMRKVRMLLALWRNWIKRPELDVPSSRGLLNPETAFLLTTLDIDWEDLQERQRFMNGEIEISELDLPRFCCPAGKGDKDKPWVDAFRGELLINVRKTWIIK
ncbi:hypothetical protein FRC12_012347 [Ceratobasidium sp. 428]|nr:hypothetical protein FRC12_012347 [Ceratobasidium sp. 428]